MVRLQRICDRPVYGPRCRVPGSLHTAVNQYCGSLDSAVIRALWCKYVEVVAKVLLRAGALVNYHDIHQATAVAIAAEDGDVPMVRLLLLASADVTLAHDGLQTPLSIAAVHCCCCCYITVVTLRVHLLMGVHLPVWPQEEVHVCRHVVDVWVIRQSRSGRTPWPAGEWPPWARGRP